MRSRDRGTSFRPTQTRRKYRLETHHSIIQPKYLDQLIVFGYMFVCVCFVHALLFVYNSETITSLNIIM